MSNQNKSLKITAFTIAVISLFTIVFSGCSSGAARTSLFENIEANLQQRSIDNAVRLIEEGKERYYSARDRVLYYLDLGMLYHYSGDYRKSNEYLTQAEYAMEELFTKSVSQGAASLLLNDNVLDYTGEDYEDIYVNIVKAVNFLNLAEFDNAFVEIRRVNDKLNLLEDKYKDLAKSYKKSEEADVEVEFKPGTSKFHNSILARYLSMLIYRAEGRLDSAKIDYNAILEGWQTQSHVYNFSKPDLSSHLLVGNKAKLNIVSFVGKPPVKKPFERRITTYQGYVIVSGNEPEVFSDTIVWPSLTSNYHFKFSLPFMQRRESEVAQVKVFVDNKPAGELELIEEIANIAIETFNVKAPIIYLKTVSRSIIKGVVAEKGKEEMKKRTNPFLGAVLSIAADVAVDASEQADIRTSRFLPGKTMIGEIEIEPGTYDIRIDYYDRYGRLLFSDEYPQKDVRPNRLNFVSTFYLQ